MIITIPLTALAQWLMNVINNHITYRVVKDMRIRALKNTEASPKYVDSHQYGEVLSRVITDVDQFRTGFDGIYPVVQRTAHDSRDTAVYVFHQSGNCRNRCGTYAGFPVCGRFYRQKTFYMFKAQSEARGDMTSLVNEILENEKVVQAFGYEEEASRRFGIINDKLADCA